MHEGHEHHHRELTMPEAISQLAGAIHALADNHKTQLILQRIDQLEHNIMSKVSDYLAQQSTFNDELEVKIDAVVTGQGALATSISGVSGDVAELNRLIQKIQDSAGEFTAEDQVTADAIQARGTALATKLAAAADALQANAEALRALDDLTPPAAPNA